MKCIDNQDFDLNLNNLLIDFGRNSNEFYSFIQPLNFQEFQLP